MRIWTLLVVVCAVIVVLALVVRVLFRPRESGGLDPHSRCLSNVKNLSLAIQMYLADYDDWFPDANQWVAALSEYYKNEDVLRCPEDGSAALCSYGMNEDLGGIALEAIARQAEVVVFFEAAQSGDNPIGGPGDVVSPGRHWGGSHYGFADGHAAWSEQIPSFAAE